MKIGVLGGGFDPVHYGHLRAAEEVGEHLKLDRVLLVPTFHPPHKRFGRTFDQRRAMVELAVKGNPALAVSPIERERAGTSFTIETIRILRRRGPDDRFYFIMGADQYNDIRSWFEPEQLLRLCRIVVINRPGSPVKRHPGRFGRNVRFVSITPLGISSTDIRRRVALGRSVRYLVPEPVVHYIRKHKLYRKEES